MNINARVKKLESTIEKLEKIITNLLQIVEPLNPKVITDFHPVEESKDELQELKELLNSPKWPAAVDPSLILDISSDQDKKDRAEGILDLIIDVHLENLKFLDYGCGEGHVVNYSKTQKPRMSIGYDVKKSKKWQEWEQEPNVLFTNDWSEVKGAGPYNIILMYDVIDHMEGTQEELISRLKEVKGLLALNGKVYVRMHPWCSRHGTHLYDKINKAFIHLVFTEAELQEMGYTQDKIRQIKLPIFEYNTIFSNAGFKIYGGPHQIKDGVDLFFINTPSIAKRIKSHYKSINRHDYKSGKFPTGPLENNFIDYILM